MTANAPGLNISYGGVAHAAPPPSFQFGPAIDGYRSYVGQSEHKEGRALAYPFNVNNATERGQADELLRQGFQGNPTGFAYHDQQHVFARSPNNTLAHWWWTPQGGVAYADWGGQCFSDPASFVFGPYNQQHIFAKGANGELFHWFWDPGTMAVSTGSWGGQIA